MARAYTDAEKTEALALYDELGANEAGRRLGIPHSTLTKWATARGLPPSDATGTAKQRMGALIARRAAFQDRVQDGIEAVFGRIEEAAGESTPEQIMDVLSGVRNPVTEAYRLGRKESASAKDWAIVYGILTDKIRLELGQVTNRDEVVASGARHQVEEKLDELARRRASG